MTSHDYILQETADLPPDGRFTDPHIMECHQHSHAILWMTYEAGSPQGSAEVIIEATHDMDEGWYAPALYIPQADNASEVVGDTLIIAPPMGQNAIKVSYHIGMYKVMPFLRVRCREVGDTENPGRIGVEGTFN